MMTSRERLLSAVAHKEPDRIPLDLGAGKSCKFTTNAYMKLLQYFGISEDCITLSKSASTAYASDAVLERLESDVRAVFPLFENVPKSQEWADSRYTYFKDEWGTGFRKPINSGLYYDMYSYPLEDTEDDEDADKGYVWPDPHPLRPEAKLQADAFRESGYPVILTENYANGMLQTGPKIYGFSTWLSILGAEKCRAKRILDKLAENKMRYWDLVGERMGNSLDVVCEMDDLGMQNSTFISLDMFKELFLPYYKTLFAYAKKKTGGKMFMHSCGSIYPFLPYLIDAGLDILGPVQISAANMDPLLLKREFGKDLCFWGGGADTQRVLPFGTPPEVRDHVKRNIDIWAPGGGYVFAAVHNIQAGVPIENIIAMWETFMDNRNY